MQLHQSQQNYCLIPCSLLQSLPLYWRWEVSGPSGVTACTWQQRNMWTYLNTTPKLLSVLCLHIHDVHACTCTLIRLKSPLSQHTQRMSVNTPIICFSSPLSTWVILMLSFHCEDQEETSSLVLPAVCLSLCQKLWQQIMWYILKVKLCV